MTWTNRKSFIAGFFAGVLFKILLIVVVVVVMATVYRDRVVAQKMENLQAPAIGDGEVARYDWKLTDSNGIARDFSEFRGKGVLLQFWSSQCMACEAEIPSMNALYEAAADSGLEVVTVAVDVEAKDLSAMAAERAVRYPVYARNGAVPECFHYTAGPATFVINPVGTILLKHVGAARWDDPQVVAWLRLVGSGQAAPH
jgi:thiol-disulfide isomerase/thioredoxin